MGKVKTWSTKSTRTLKRITIVHSKAVLIVERWDLSQTGWRPWPRRRGYRLCADHRSLIFLESRVHQWSPFVSSLLRSVAAAVRRGDVMGPVDREAVA